MGVVNSDLYRAFSRLATRLRFKDAPAVTTGVSSNVIAVTDFDELLREIKVLAVTADISSGSGSSTYFTVPSGKRWQILRIEMPATSGSTHPFYGLAGGNVDLMSNATGARFHVGNKDPLDQGDTIKIVNTGNGGDSSREMVVYYTQEDSF